LAGHTNMAQTGYTPISIYYSSTATNVPTAGNLVAGELAINTADGKLFYKDSAGVVQVIGTKGGVGTSSTTQVLYNSSGLVVGSANMTFSGTTLTLANDASISGLTVGKGGGAVSTNTTVGASALATNSTGQYSTAIGNLALNLMASTVENTAVGYAAARDTTGNYNTAVGSQALKLTTTGSSNTAIGQQALNSNTTASSNTAVGYQAGYTQTTNGSNVMFGYQAGYGNTAGSLTAVGYQAGYSNTDGNGGTFIGSQAGKANTSGNGNCGVGASVLYTNTTGSFNASFGSASLYNNTTGGANTVNGYFALFSNTTASYNTALGYQAGYSNTTGQYNTFVGSTAGVANTTGSYNTIMGWQAGASTTTVNGNTLVGYYAGQATTGAANTFIGQAAGYTVTTGANNTIIGAYSGNNGGLDIRTSSNYIVLSDGAGNPNGYFDANGTFYLWQTRNGYYAQQIYRNYFGSYWYSAALTTSTPDFRIYNQNGAGTYMSWGATSWSGSSDERLKTITSEIDNGLSKVNTLRAVNFTWKSDDTNTAHVGLIAQDVQKVLPEAISEDEEGHLGVRYTEVIPLLVAAIKELKAEFDAYKATHP